MFNYYLDIAVIVLGFLLTLIICLSYKKNHSRELLSYIPNIWTSLGILGTFAAIVISLSPEKASELKDVARLISNIAPAFHTSIIGILGAITSSIVIKCFFASEDFDEEKQSKKCIGAIVSSNEKLDKLDSIDKSLKEKLYDPEKKLQFLNESISTINSNIKDLKAELFKKMSDTTTAEKMGKLFLEQLATKLDGFYKNLYETESRKAQEITGRFLGGINEIVKKNDETISKCTAGFLEESNKKFSEYIEFQKKAIEDITKQLSSCVNANSSLVTKTFNDINEKFSKQSEVAIQQYSEYSLKMSDFIENQRQNVETLNNQYVKDQKALADQCSQEIKNSIINTLLPNYDEYVKLNKEIQNEVITMLADKDKVWKENIGTVKLLTEGAVRSFNESIGEYKKAVDECKEKISSSLSNGADKLEESNRCLNETSSNFSRFKSEVENSVNSNIAELKELIIAIKDEKDQFAESTKTATEKIVENGTALSNLGETLKGYTDNCLKVTDNADNAIVEIKEKIESVEKLMILLNEKPDLLIDKIGELSVALDKLLKKINDLSGESDSKSQRKELKENTND